MFLGIQKYFTIGLFVALVIAVLSAAYFRSSYESEYAARQQLQNQLTETIASYDAQKRVNEAQIESLTRAREAERVAAAALRSNRERILNAPQNQDGAVSPVLRCAVTGVCNGSSND